MRLQGRLPFLQHVTKCSVCGCCCSQWLPAPLGMAPGSSITGLGRQLFRVIQTHFHVRCLRNSRASKRLFAGLHRALEKPLVYCVFSLFALIQYQAFLQGIMCRLLSSISSKSLFFTNCKSWILTTLRKVFISIFPISRLEIEQRFTHSLLSKPKGSNISRLHLPRNAALLLCS